LVSGLSSQGRRARLTGACRSLDPSPSSSQATVKSAAGGCGRQRLEAPMAANHHPRTLAAALLGLAVICSLTAASAQARAVSVSGTQTLVDEQAGTYKMHGDLVGDWQITA